MTDIELDHWHKLVLRQAATGILSQREVAIAVFLCNEDRIGYEFARAVQELVRAGLLAAPKRWDTWRPKRPGRWLYRAATLTAAGQQLATAGEDR